MNARRSRLLGVAIAAAVSLLAGPGHGQDEAGTVSRLIRDLKDPDFDKAYRAAEEVGKHSRYRTQVVAGLVEAIATRDWNRCAGDMRDTIARALGELKAKEAVAPLLELVKSGKPIEHECAE